MLKTRGKPKVAAYDSRLLNTDRYFLQPELLRVVTMLPKIKQNKKKNPNCYTPIEDGTYYRITHGGRAASTSLSGAYLQNYSSYGYENSWVDRSHQGGVQCAGIITLASLIFQLLPFVFFSYLNFVRSISPKLY